VELGFRPFIKWPLVVTQTELRRSQRRHSKDIAIDRDDADFALHDKETDMSDFFKPVRFGDLKLANRIVMAPMTRARADLDGTPNASAAEYYRQRASAGLIISEAANVGPMSAAFERAPGLWTEEQTAGWRPIVAGVKAQGGCMVAQLWHSGRAAARGLLGDREPLSPSGINHDLDSLQVWALLQNGAYVRIAATQSRAMTQAEIKCVVEEYRVAAANALEAGFDGVEIHAANGYLPHQFLSAGTNRREDHYGGDATGRSRFLREIIEAVSRVMPLSRVGLRLSPYAAYNNVDDPEPDDTYGHLAAWIETAGLAYVHLADTNAWSGAADLQRILALFKPRYTGALIVNAGISPEHGADILRKGEANAVAFGRLFIANPDLPDRIRRCGPYNPLRHIGLYGGTATGYLDYPSLPSRAS
jgi:N-ethylmaleimide reductase